MIPFLMTLLRFVNAVRGSLRDPDFQALSFLVFVTLLSGTLFYTNVEGWSLLDSLYFSVITLTTIGYGDLAPATALGKTFTIFYVLFGIGLIAAFVGKVAARAVETRGLRQSRRPPKPDPAREDDSA